MKQLLQLKHLLSLTVEWHRPQSNTARVEEELIEMSTKALSHTTDPLQKLRLMCLQRGASGILGLGRIFRSMDNDGSNQLNKEKFMFGLNEASLNLSHYEVEDLFMKFDTDNSGLINLDEFLVHLRPPMAEARQAIVEQVFSKLRTGYGTVCLEDIRGLYAVQSNPRYMSGEETADFVLTKFLSNFETDDQVDGKVTLEEFINFYSCISLSIDNDCFFNLMMRQAFKL